MGSLAVGSAMIMGGVSEDQAGNAGATAAIANELGMPELAVQGADAFTDSLQFAGVVGAVLITLVAVAVFLLTPKGTTVS